MAGNFQHLNIEFGLQKSEESYAEWKKYWLNYTENQSKSAFSPSPKHEPGMSKKLKKEAPKQRWCFTLRHGERIDLTYGQWIPYCFDENSIYIRKDLNMPPCLPERDGGKDSYLWDTPLTLVGQLQARSVGEGLRNAGIAIDFVYSSPALRCVETAHYFILGIGDPSIKIRVEPALFEQTIWHLNKGTGLFMTTEELEKAGYNVDVNYTPFSKLNLKCAENSQECFNRTADVIKRTIADTENKGGNIIFVGHAMTLQIMAITLQNLQEKEITYSDETLYKNMDKVPYCGLAAMKSKPWRLVEPPCPPFMNSSSGRFDWKILL